MTSLYPRQPSPLALSAHDDTVYGQSAAESALCLLRSGFPHLARFMLDVFTSTDDRAWEAVYWLATHQGRHLFPHRLDEVALEGLIADLNDEALCEAHQVAAALIVGLRGGASDGAEELWGTLSVIERKEVTRATLNIVANAA